MTPHRPARWAAALLTPVAALALVATPALAQPGFSPSAVRYVALGDSYAAGPLIPLQTGQPAGCLRSNRNYPSLVADTLGIESFDDVSCSGATTDDLTTDQPVSLGTNPPQFDALAADTDLVTLTIGGNDIGFVPIITDCAARSPLKPRGAACKDFYTAGGTDQLAARIADTADEIAAALAGIQARSPAARVLLVGYPAILPEDKGCFPLVPFSAGDVAYLRDTEKRLNAMLEGQADTAGIDYVDTYTPTIGHDICTLPGKKWIEGLVPTSPAAPVHLNAQGMAGIAAVVVGALADMAVLAPGA